MKSLLAASVVISIGASVAAQVPKVDTTDTSAAGRAKAAADWTDAWETKINEERIKSANDAWKLRLIEKARVSKVRKWQCDGPQGMKLEGRFAEANKTAAFFMTENGSIVDMPLKRLSKEDQTIIKELMKQQEKEQKAKLDAEKKAALETQKKAKQDAIKSKVDAKKELEELKSEKKKPDAPATTNPGK